MSTDMATASQMAQLLKLISDKSPEELQRLLDNWPVLEQIANNNVSPPELEQLIQERFVPLSNYGIDVGDLRWAVLRERMRACALRWSQLSVLETDGTYVSFPPGKPPEDLKVLNDFFGQSPDRWLVRLPAAP